MANLRLTSLSGFRADATVTDDGRVDISVGETDPVKLAALLAGRRRVAKPGAAAPCPSSAAPPPPGPLDIVVQVVGSRGDVQPFVALGHELQRTYGHRVRLVTHAVFRALVEAPAAGGSRLQFADIGGGDPAELMAFMVKNGGGTRSGEGGEGGEGGEDGEASGPGGIIPPLAAYTSGEIAQRRRFIEAVLQGCWRSVVADDGDGDQAGGGGGGSPFVADAIIANPPSFAHIHVAEALGLPLHIMFTMPWTPTRAFPHPLANLRCVTAASASATAASPLYGFACYLSYTLVECLTWQGLGDVVNRFRTRDLGLAPLSPLLAVAPLHPGGLLGRLRVPTTYCWSPALLPKPPDWAAEVGVAGYFWAPDGADGAEGPLSDYTPPPALAAFLDAGPPPVYIGFGSIVVDDPAALTRTVLDAVGQLPAGTRAILSSGWGALGELPVADSSRIFLLPDCPHEWLFPRVACVVHHGGAGTTAAGLRSGVPTVVVPFFGDQPFWGALVARAGAGPPPVPFVQLTAGRLAGAMAAALQPATRERAKAVGATIRRDSVRGTAKGAQAFHDHLPRGLGCALLPGEVAVWRHRGRAGQSLSARAAAVLVDGGALAYADLDLLRARSYRLHADDEPREPLSAVGAALLGDLSSMAMAVADFPKELFQRGAGTGSAAAADFATAAQAVQSVGRVVAAGLQTPENFCTGLARGLHNAPRLYHDTVRRQPGARGSKDGEDGGEDAITGLGGGLRAAATAFGLGLYDGVTGLVTQPLRGADTGGAPGLVKGFARGLGGVVLKPAAGAWAVPAYALQGVHAEVRRVVGGLDGSSQAQRARVQARRAARQRQGAAALAATSAAERAAILAGWAAEEG